MLHILEHVSAKWFGHSYHDGQDIDVAVLAALAVLTAAVAHFLQLHFQAIRCSK